VELEAMLAELKATVSSQQKEIVDRELHISSLDQQLKVTNRTLDDLQLELSRSTSTVQVSAF
jgi:chromosome segregation ATPase